MPALLAVLSKRRGLAATTVEGHRQAHADQRPLPHKAHRQYHGAWREIPPAFLHEHYAPSLKTRPRAIETSTDSLTTYVNIDNSRL